MKEIKKIMIIGIIFSIVSGAFIPSINSQFETQGNNINQKNQAMEQEFGKSNTKYQPVLNGRLEDVYLSHGKRINFGNLT